MKNTYWSLAAFGRERSAIGTWLGKGSMLALVAGACLLLPDDAGAVTVRPASAFDRSVTLGVPEALVLPPVPQAVAEANLAGSVPATDREIDAAQSVREGGEPPLARPAPGSVAGAGRPASVGSPAPQWLAPLPRLWGGSGPCHWRNPGFGAAEHRDRCGYAAVVSGRSGIGKFLGIPAPAGGRGGGGPTEPAGPSVKPGPVPGTVPPSPVPLPPSWFLLVGAAASLLFKQRS